MLSRKQEHSAAPYPAPHHEQAPLLARLRNVGMALNWAMISDDGTKPVPLPREKVFYSAEKCHLT